MYDTKYTRKRKKKVSTAEKSENVGNFYLRRAKVGRSDEQMFRSRRSDYGKKQTPEGGILPVPLTGTIEF